MEGHRSPLRGAGRFVRSRRLTHRLRRIADREPQIGTVVAIVVHVADARFRGLKDEDLADIWYALSTCAARHPHQFKALTDAVLNELLARRGDGLKWLEQRFQAIRLAESKENV